MDKVLKISWILGVLILMGANSNTLYQHAVSNPKRPSTDVVKDKLRDPEIALKFSGIKAGMKVFDFFTGAGYYAFLMSDIVGEKGHVIAQNPSKIYTLFKNVREAVDKRKANSHFKNVSWLDSPIEEFTGVKSNSQDFIMSHLVLHDTFWLSDKPEKTIKEFYRILKPGGTMVIIDHAAAKGRGASDAINRKCIHRIEEAYVIKIFKKVGFELEAKSDVFKNNYDDGTKPFFSKELSGKKTSRFMLKMKKPD